MLWLDKLTDIDKKFNFETFVDKVLAAEVEHANSEIFTRIFTLMDVLRNDESLE